MWKTKIWINNKRWKTEEMDCRNNKSKMGWRVGRGLRAENTYSKVEKCCFFSLSKLSLFFPLQKNKKQKTRFYLHTYYTLPYLFWNDIILKFVYLVGIYKLFHLTIRYIYKLTSATIKVFLYLIDNWKKVTY